MDRIYRLAHEFRVAMNRANDAGLFKQIMRFEDFPRGSCGDTCYLLAEYLLEHNIYTEYVCGTKWPQSHAWLVVTTEEEFEQKRIAKNKKRIVVSEHSNGYEIIVNGWETETALVSVRDIGAGKKKKDATKAGFANMAMYE